MSYLSTDLQAFDTAKSDSSGREPLEHLSGAFLYRFFHSASLSLSKYFFSASPFVLRAFGLSLGSNLS